MQSRVAISLTELEQEADECRAVVKRCGLPALFASVDPGAYGTTRVSLSLLECLEGAGALFLEMTKRIANVFDRESRTPPPGFVNLYSLYIAASEGAFSAGALGEASVTVKGGLERGKWRAMLAQSPPSLLHALMADYGSYIAFYRDHRDPGKRLASDRDIAHATGAYFRLLAGTLRAEGEDALYELSLRALEGVEIEVEGAAYRLFERSERSERGGAGLLDIRPHDIVGNAEYLEASLRLARDTAGFDFAAGRNPKRTNPVLFALGRPGCGKTATAHAAGNYFLEFCRERDIRADFVIIRRTDWASSYQNASAQQLLKIFRERVEQAPGVVGVYWPDIDTAFAAREESGVRNEEKNILGACFGIFDGTLLPKNGKWFMLCDANYMHMDEATVSRITQDPYYIRGVETPGDYLALLRDRKLGEHADFLRLSEDEWQAAGEKCVEYDFSGREIENISRKVISRVEDFEYPEEYFKAGFEERRRIIRECSKPVGFHALREILDSYFRFERQAQEKAERKRFEDRVRDIAFSLRAEALAREEFT